MRVRGGYNMSIRRVEDIRCVYEKVLEQYV